MSDKTIMKQEASEDQDAVPDQPKTKIPDQQTEIGGRKGPEPTRYGDWEKNGIISDF
jgi:hypothetical protein